MLRERYYKLKEQHPERWRAAVEAEHARQKRKLAATFADRHPERANMQPCIKCGAEFLPRRRGGNLQRFCSARCKEHEDNRRRRVRHPNRVKVGLRKLRAQRAAQWNAYISAQSCAHCGENHPATLDHHHIDRRTKSFPVAKWPAHRWERVLQEIAKRVVLCANCHRKVEWDLRKVEGKAA